MSQQPFMHLRLVGSRYRDHSIPLEILKNVAVLEEMVLEVAKYKFLADHPDRKRLPRGFTKNLRLRLTAVNPGSANLVIEIASDPPDLSPTYAREYPNRARDAIMEAVSAAENSRPVESILPESALSHFEKFGHSLKEDEIVVFESPNGVHTASFTNDARRSMTRSTRKVKELSKEVIIRGTVPEADQSDMTFEIQLLEGRRIKAPIAGHHLETILEAFNGYRNGMRALVHGVGRFRPGDHLIGFKTIEHVSVLDPLDFGAQLDDLRRLEDGWLDGDGKAPSSVGLNWLHRAFECNYPDEVPLPHLYPTETGGVQAEWSFEPNEITLDLNLETHLAEWHVLNLMSDDVSERTLNCDDAADWRWLVERLKGMTVGDV